MANIRNRILDDDVKRHLRVRAAEHGSWVEEEARDILRQFVSLPNVPRDVGQAIHEHFSSLGGVDIAPA